MARVLVPRWVERAGGPKPGDGLPVSVTMLSWRGGGGDNGCHSSPPVFHNHLHIPASEDPCQAAALCGAHEAQRSIAGGWHAAAGCSLRPLSFTPGEM